MKRNSFKINVSFSIYFSLPLLAHLFSRQTRACKRANEYVHYMQAGNADCSCVLFKGKDYTKADE